MYTDFFSLSLLGIGLTFSLFISFIFFYKIYFFSRNGKLIRGKIIAFHKQMHINRSNNQTTYTTTIKPIIEFYFNSGKYYLRGSNQNFLNLEINQQVDLYSLAKGSEYTLMKRNSYRLFSVAFFLFIFVPLCFVSYNKVSENYNNLLFLILGIVIFLSIGKVILNKINKHEKFTFYSFLKNKDVMSHNEYLEIENKLLFNKSFKKEKSKTHFFGIILSSIMLIFFSFILNLRWKRLSFTNKETYKKSFENIELIKNNILNPEQNNFFILTILSAFCLMSIYALTLNIVKYIRNN